MARIKAKKNDMTNFFLNRDKVLFFIGLSDSALSSKIVYALRKKYKISLHQCQVIIKALEEYGLGKYYYDNDAGYYIFKFSNAGLHLRNELINIGSMLKRLDIWK
jgi:hypothetical protein